MATPTPRRHPFHAYVSSMLVLAIMVPALAHAQALLFAGTDTRISTSISAHVLNLPDTCAQVPAGLVSWWPGEGDASDIWGSNDGTIGFGTTFASGIVGEAFRFNGVSGYINVSDSPTLDLTHYTLEAWIWSDSVDEWRSILSKGPDYEENYALQLESNADFIHHVLNIQGERQTFDTPPGSIPTQTWVHVVGTFDGIVAKTYLNGGLAAMLPINGAPATNDRALLIGAKEHEWGVFDGFIDEVSIYNRALSTAEVQSIYQAGAAGKCRAQSLIEQIAGLRTEVQHLPTAQVLNKGQANALMTKLDGALSKLERGNKTAAANHLRAFVNQVNAFRQAKILSAAQARPLLDQANAIIKQLRD